MSSPNIAQRICDFLVQQCPRMYCDACIRDRLGLKWRQQVQLVTATLSATVLFERKLDRCSNCNETKQITASVKNALDYANLTTPRQKLGVRFLKQRRERVSISSQRNVQPHESIRGGDDRPKQK
jgi:hypothetical protein